MEHLMTSDEVAEYLRVDVVTIRRLVNRGELAAYRVGSEYRFKLSDLEDYLQRQRISAGEEHKYSDEPTDEFIQKAGKKFMSDRGRFDKFTERARKVLNLAQEEARRFQHNYIGTEHLLLGLVREGEGVAVQVLINLGVDLNQVCNQIESIIGHGGRIILGEIGLTPRAKKVIELAVDEARRSGQHYVGTEHVLLGLLRVDDGIAASVLKSLGVDVAKARMQINQVLNAPRTTFPPVPPEASSLLAEGEQALTCSRCGARCPRYFHYCFNCGQRLVSE